MPKKPTFPEPGCWRCPHYTVQGKFPCEARYCMGTGRKHGKRFKKADPQYKAPKWCPRRLAPKICRVYRLRGEHERLLEQVRREGSNPKKHESFPTFAFRYDPKPRYEAPISLTARQFYELANREGLESVLEDVEAEYGDVIEIDDGLQPYSFYYYAFARLLPTMGLSLSRQNR